MKKESRRLTKASGFFFWEILLYFGFIKRKGLLCT